MPRQVGGTCACAARIQQRDQGGERGLRIVQGKGELAGHLHNARGVLLCLHWPDCYVGCGLQMHMRSATICAGSAAYAPGGGTGFFCRKLPVGKVAT